MEDMNRPEHVKGQYRDDANLSTRIKLHRKYSTSAVDFSTWLFAQYEFPAAARVLELGCGNAWQWEEHLRLLPRDCLLVLSDLSMGMAEIAQKKFGAYPFVLAQRADIQDIPFPDGSFEVVIANHMLYHVPDLERALAEVRRVLKPGGRFYAATNGSGGMQAHLHAALKEFNPALDAFDGTPSFCLQNGADLLRRHFGSVERRDFEDSLRVTRTQDLIDWLRSTITLSGLSPHDFDGLFEYFEAIRQREGAIRIPKESGLFIALRSGA